MNTIFALSAVPLLLVSALFGVAAAAVGLVMLAWSRVRFAATPQSLPVAPFFTGITTVWALSMGFVAADMWAVRGQAEQAASAERSSISRLYGMAMPDAIDAPDLRVTLADYAQAVERGEWGAGANAEPDAAVEAALQRMRLAIVALARSETPAPLMAKMAQDFDELQDARNTRLAIGSSTVSEYKWILVLVLTVLSMIGIAAVHGDRPPAGRTALAIFTAAAVVSLWVMAVHADPYTGGARIVFKPPAMAAAG